MVSALAAETPTVIDSKTREILVYILLALVLLVVFLLLHFR